MTDIFRRRLFGAAAATGLAAVPAHAARVDADEELLKKDYPAGRRSAALGQPAPMPEPEARLSGTYDLGASTLNEGEVINASPLGRRLRACSGRQDDASASVRVRLCAESQSHLCHLPYSPSRIRQPMVREGWLRTARRAVAAAAKRSSCPSPGKRHSTSWQAK